jgi:uncharacterized protein YjiS (DUF1127 family)
MEAKMKNILTRPISLHDVAPNVSAEVSRRHASLLGIRGILATWSGRMRFRWELDQMSKANPHLIDDIGLTRRQVEAEIAKRFWQP